MRLFLFVFLLIYGAMHIYLLLKLESAFPFTIKSRLYFVPLMTIAITSPFIVWASERTGFVLVSRLFSYGGYIWMGLLFLFVSSSLVIDIYRLFIHLITYVIKIDVTSINLSERSAFIIPLIFSLSAGLYGYFEARDIHTERITVKTSKLPEGIDRLRIVQLSDVHLGLIIREERLRKILNEVKKAEPDILVSTGDLVDGQMNELEGMDKLFREIKPRYGKFAITGNHEFYAGIKHAIDFTERSGFKLLRNEVLTVDGIINIAGLDDPAGKYYGVYQEIVEKDILSSLSKDRFTLLLKHRPMVDKDAIGLFDLQLSGHTHKGQIFPFGIITRLYYPVDAGGMRIMDNSYLYVSRGAGTWGPPIRFLSPPEITIIEIIRS